MSLRASLPMITIEMLFAKKACANQVALFRKTFGESADITLGNCLKASSVGLSISWAAENLLSPPARETYEEAAAAAWEAYRQAIASAWEAYDEAAADAWEVYEEAAAAAREVYRRALAAAFFAAAVKHAEIAE